MSKQTKSFIVEKKPSRKPKPTDRKTSIWGTLDLKPIDDEPVPPRAESKPATLEGGRP